MLPTRVLHSEPQAAMRGLARTESKQYRADTPAGLLILLIRRPQLAWVHCLARSILASSASLAPSVQIVLDVMRAPLVANRGKCIFAVFGRRVMLLQQLVLFLVEHLLQTGDLDQSRVLRFLLRRFGRGLPGVAGVAAASVDSVAAGATV